MHPGGGEKRFNSPRHAGGVNCQPLVNALIAEFFDESINFMIPAGQGIRTG